MSAPTAEGVFNMPDKQYFEIQALSSSAVKHFRRSPAHVKAYMDQPATAGTTTAMLEGTGFHWCMLQPDLWASKVVRDPGINKNRKHYKQWRKMVPEGSLILPGNTIDRIEAMARNAHSKASIKQYLQAGWPERVLVWFDSEYGIWMKCKVDWITADGQALVDLKKSQSAAEFGFTRSIYRYDYYLQAAHYLRGFKHLAGLGHADRVRWCWLVSEIDEPNDCNLFIADPVAIDEAGDQLAVWYERYAQCLANDDWPGYPDEPIHLGYEFEPMVDGMAF